MNTEVRLDRQAAYRRLLCFGFADIAARRCRQSPQDVECVAAIGDWLHMLAAHAAHDFVRFNEDWFWLEHRTLVRRFPRCDLGSYRRHFEVRPANLRTD